MLRMSTPSSTWVLRGLIALAVGAWASAASSGEAVQRLSERARADLAIKAENGLRHRLDQPAKVEHFRKQSFRFGSGAKAASVVTFAWTPGSGGQTHCLLNIFHGDKLTAIDLLDPDPGLPWSCDGEPVLKITHVDADGCLDVIAMAPFSPPSGERFMHAVVVTCGADGRSHALDRPRTAWLAAAAEAGQSVDTLADAVRTLRSFKPKPSAR
jgi:hypothetical protein